MKDPREWFRGPTVDFAFRTLYRTAYRAMKLYWSIRRPETHGALVAVWHDGRILLIRNSYTTYYSLPGGYVRSTETGRDAAVRELAEEVGVHVSPDRLVPAVETTHEWEGKTDHVEIFSLELSDRPRVEVDNREVVAAEFFEPEVAMGLKLFPPIRSAIDAYRAAQP